MRQADDATAAELSRAENVRGASGEPAAAEHSGPHEGALDQLGVEIEGIAAATALLACQGTSAVGRTALELVSAQTARAAWLVRAAALFRAQEQRETRLAVLGPMLERVRQDLSAELRLGGTAVELCVPDWNVSAVVDEQAAMTGIAGAIVATLGLLDERRAATIGVIAVNTAGALVSIDVVQEAAMVPAAMAGRFFEFSSARPGGRIAAIGALAARAAARLHGGDPSFMAGSGRGSTLRLTFGRAR